MKRLGQWSLRSVTALCALWFVFAFFAFKWWVAPWMMRGAYEAVMEYGRTHPEVGPIGPVSIGATEQFLWVAFLPPLILLVLWLLGRTRHVGGGLIHLLLVVALVVFVINLLTGRRTV